MSTTPSEQNRKNRQGTAIGFNNIGFIGLGVMGEPMCRNLCKRLLPKSLPKSLAKPLADAATDAADTGVSIAVFDLDDHRVNTLVQSGAVAAASMAELSRQADVILLSLPGDREVEAVLSGPDGVFANAQANTLIIDCSTTSVTLTRSLAETAAGHGLRYLDSPVARTRAAAEAGTLAMMVGGEQTHFASASALLSCMASDVLHVGAVGCGQMAKILNNMVLFQTVAAIAEAQTMANRAGLSTERLFDALEQGSANSFALSQHGRKAMQTGEFPLQAFSVEYARKDLSYARQLAMDTGTPVSGADNVDKLFAQAIEAGCGDQYWPVILQMLQQTDKNL